VPKAGGEARAPAAILGKIGGATEPGTTIFRDPSDTAARIVNRLAGPATREPVLLPADDRTALRSTSKG
jgi:hypothetical protein